MNAFKPLAIAGCCLGLLAACASTSTAPVLLTLPPSASTPAVASQSAVAGSPAPLLAVLRVGIPEYLVARRVRYRTDASTLAEWPNTYWAERIEIGVSREFVSALRQQLPGWALCELNCAEQSPAGTVQVDLLSMDYLRGAQRLQARARITLSGPGPAPKVLQSKELSYDLPATGDTPQAQAQAMSNVIQQVAAATAPLVISTKR